MNKSFDIIEKVGVSNECVCDAIESLLKETSKKNKISWFEVKEIRGRVDEKGKVEYQVSMKIGTK